MQPTGPDEFYAAATRAAADTELNRKLENASARHFEHMAVAKAEFPPYEAERDVARRIKEESITGSISSWFNSRTSSKRAGSRCFSPRMRRRRAITS